MRGLDRKLFSLALFAVIGTLIAVFLFFDNKPCAHFQEKAIIVPSGSLSVAVMQTPEEQARGLGGCEYIPARSGMLFPISERREATFWMKGMVIPIDIVWIADGRIVGVDANVPYPEEGTPDSELPLYGSPGEVDAVLEVGAGKAQGYGLVKGAPVRLDK